MQKTRTLISLAALGALALAAHPAHAAVTLTAQDSTATAGGTGFFDVNLFNDLTGPAVSPASFTFELTVAGASGITFTNADMLTANTYLFNNNSFDTTNGLPLSTSTFPTTDISANDTANTGATTVNPSDTFGLGRVYYSVAPGTTAGPVTVSFVSSGTSLADGSAPANPIPFTTQEGTITVTPNASPAPEPSEVGVLALLGMGLGGLLLRARRRTA